AASRFAIRFGSGAVLETVAEGFGFNGEKAIFNFQTTAATGFYGFGERTKRFNKAGDTLDFFTVDGVAVFPHRSERHDFGPSCGSIPLGFVRSGEAFFGLYLANRERLVLGVGNIAPGHLICQSLAGNNDLSFIAGPPLRDVVRHFTALTGRAEV